MSLTRGKWVAGYHLPALLIGEHSVLAARGLKQSHTRDDASHVNDDKPKQRGCKYVCVATSIHPVCAPTVGLGGAPVLAVQGPPVDEVQVHRLMGPSIQSTLIFFPFT